MTSPGAMFLRIVQGPGRGQVLPISEQQPITLGRSAQSTFAFEDMQLSRAHCQLEARGGQCRIVDLRSRNGTFVNGQQIGAVLLRPGDRIQIGGIVFEVCDQATPPPPPPPPPAAPTAPPAACDGCKKPLEARLGRALGGRWLCTRCFDRFDVEEDLIEGFQLLERLDVSSFGTTYLARQKLMERLVVVKTIQAGEGTDQVAVRRLLREAKTAGRLTHPHIVELYDVHETQGLLYVVIEHVEGENLDRIMRERAGVPLPLAQVLQVMSQVADALAHAHEHKVVHRDVKPANVVIRKSDGLAKLQGFTLAKHLEGQSVITADGESLGTPYFMPPEQVRSAKLADVRSDVYGWAATTYYCLSGKLPLEARSYSAFVDKVFNSVPAPLDEVLPGAPAPLSALLARCLERDPARRPQSFAQLRRELAPLLQEGR